MAAPVVSLLAEACAAQVEISRDARGALLLRAPQNAVALARRLRDRQAEVLLLFDWTHAALDESAPCVLCGRPALLRDPADRRPCHKVCVDRLLHRAATARGRRGAKEPA